MTMATLWFLILAAALVAYVVLDGFDLGVGALYKWIAREPGDRAALRASIGPVWDANEVWLIAAGGISYLAFPALFASAMSGFYLPLMIVLWLLIGRAMGLEVRHHLGDPLAQEICDTVFAVSSTLLPFVFGVALGNVIRGVPFDAEGYFFLPLWTSFRAGDENPGVLDWYTILCGLVALGALGTHGAHFLAARTSGPVNARAVRVARIGTHLLPLLTVASLAGTLAVRPSVVYNFGKHPVGLLVPIAVVGSLVAMELFVRRGQEWRAFGASCVYLASLLGGAAFALYPTMLPSSANALRAITVENAASGARGLRIALVWWMVAFVLVALSFQYLYRSFRGKISAPPA